MPTVFTHAAAAVCIGTLMVPGRVRLFAVGIACAVLPDLDVVAFGLGIPYHGMLGHRGLSHSLAFAAGLAAVTTWLVVRRDRSDVGALPLGLFLFLATASHGALDAMTDGGLGIAFFAPLSDARYFFSWRPIAVSPISIARFAAGEGLDVVASEIALVWVPAILLSAGAVALRRWRA